MARIWSFRETDGSTENLPTQNVYTRYTLNAERRNAMLMLVPTMHTIAHGERNLIGESYSRVKVTGIGKYTIERQLACGTVPHNRRVMTALHQYATPDLYGITLYAGYLLSPFNRANRHYYHYSISNSNQSTALVAFKPILTSTQLVSGQAVIEQATGRITFVTFFGEFDMLEFSVTAKMDDSGLSMLPERCTAECKFKFIGNRITAALTTLYKCNKTLADSSDSLTDRELMERLRPMPLRHKEEMIYRLYDQQKAAADTLKKDSTSKSESQRIENLAWNFIDDNLMSALSATGKQAFFRMSPIINPQYLSYSHSKGVSYKINAGGRYAWSDNCFATLNPTIGYNFKQKQFYYFIPLRMTYNNRRNGYAELSWGNGNRISNAQLAEDFSRVLGDTLSAPTYTDEYLKVSNNLTVGRMLEINAGIVYHRRSCSDKRLASLAGLPKEYRSSAPAVTVRLTPWKTGPTFTANYERSIKGMLGANLEYERWELDAAMKQRLLSIRQMNGRIGTGFYTSRNSMHFVDFANFRDESLPTGWDDEWAGQFQLLDPRQYNSSQYYVRGHLSYDSPFLMLSWVPWIGKYVEMERIYVSGLALEQSRPYGEIGYGFTNRVVSAGIFAGFNTKRFHSLGCKFTIELFKRW